MYCRLTKTVEQTESVSISGFRIAGVGNIAPRTWDADMAVNRQKLLFLEVFGRSTLNRSRHCFDGYKGLKPC